MPCAGAKDRTWIFEIESAEGANTVAPVTCRDSLHSASAVMSGLSAASAPASPLRRRPTRADVDLHHRAGRGERYGRDLLFHPLDLRGRPFQEDAAIVLDRELDHARAAFLEELLLSNDKTRFQRGMRGADRRMPGERQLLPRREDAQAIVGVDDFSRKVVSEIRPAGDALHRRRIEPVGADHHGDRVAEERLVGEDVDLRELHEREGFTSASFTSRSRLWCASVKVGSSGDRGSAPRPRRCAPTRAACGCGSR